MRRQSFHGNSPKKKQLKFDFKMDSRTIWIIALSVSAIILTAARFWVLPATMNPDEPEIRQISDGDKIIVLQHIKDVFEEYHIQDDWQIQRGSYVEVQIPRKMDFLKLYSSVDKRMEALANTSISCKETDENQFLMKINIDEQPACSYLFKRKLPLGYVAIVIDDFGYDYNNLASEFLRFRYPITVSIIPGLADSRTVGREASLLGKEVLVHMPMEPLNAAYDDNGYMLYANQENSIVRMRIKQAFSQLPGAVGMNNHQGSKATMQPQLMNTVMSELKSMDKIFIDSFTSPKTVGYKTARRMGVKTAVNKLFIDAKYDEQFMNSQFDRIAELASKGENVVAIGHVRKKTLDALQKKVPELDERGIEFVSISQLVN